MYSSIVFSTSQLIAEMPYSVLCAVAFFLLFYFPIGLQSASDRAGYHFFLVLVAEICEFADLIYLASYWRSRILLSPNRLGHARSGSRRHLAFDHGRCALQPVRPPFAHRTFNPTGY